MIISIAISIMEISTLTVNITDDFSNIRIVLWRVEMPRVFKLSPGLLGVVFARVLLLLL